MPACRASGVCHRFPPVGRQAIFSARQQRRGLFFGAKESLGVSVRRTNKYLSATVFGLESESVCRFVAID